MFKKIIASFLILTMCCLFPFQTTLATENGLPKKVFLENPKIELNGKNYTLLKKLNAIYLVNDTEKIRIATINIEGITDRKSSTILRASYSWTSTLAKKYSIHLEDKIFVINITSIVLSQLIFSILPFGANMLASIASTCITNQYIDYLIKTQPDTIYVTLNYKEQLGCPFRLLYIDTNLYLDASRNNLWKNIPLNQEIFSGNQNDFTLPAACRL